MTEKTEITIDGDNIIYNGVRYEKVKTVPSEKPFKLHCLFADILEDELMGYEDIQDALNGIDVIADHLLEQMSQYIPEYSDWGDYLSKEFPNQTLPQEKCDLFRLGWNSYCNKMWSMVIDD